MERPEQVLEADDSSDTDIEDSNLFTESTNPSNTPQIDALFEAIEDMQFESGEILNAKPSLPTRAPRRRTIPAVPPLRPERTPTPAPAPGPVRKAPETVPTTR